VKNEIPDSIHVGIFKINMRETANFLAGKFEALGKL
jgi:hypothetical protein